MGEFFELLILQIPGGPVMHMQDCIVTQPLILEIVIVWKTIFPGGRGTYQNKLCRRHSRRVKHAATPSVFLI